MSNHTYNPDLRAGKNWTDISQGGVSHAPPNNTGNEVSHRQTMAHLIRTPKGVWIKMSNGKVLTKAELREHYLKQIEKYKQLQKTAVEPWRIQAIIDNFELELSQLGQQQPLSNYII